VKKLLSSAILLILSQVCAFRHAGVSQKASAAKKNAQATENRLRIQKRQK
jgi:hypothetical protein